jgi:hypothetical protein
MIIRIITISGCIEIILGFLALRYTKRRLCKVKNSYQRKLRKVALIAGGVLAAASWPCTFLLGYPYSFGDETGRIVGIPFVVAYFDSAGKDYVSSFMLPAMIGNAAFWFTVPHILLAVYLFLHRQWK